MMHGSLVGLMYLELEAYNRQLPIHYSIPACFGAQSAAVCSTATIECIQPIERTNMLVPTHVSPPCRSAHPGF